MLSAIRIVCLFFCFFVFRFLLGWLVFVLVLFADLVYVINTNAYDPRYAKKKGTTNKEYFVAGNACIQFGKLCASTEVQVLRSD